MIDTCKNCFSNNLELKEQYELFNPETNEIDFVSGYLCTDCECFHDINGEYFQYDVKTNQKSNITFIKQHNDIT